MSVFFPRETRTIPLAMENRLTQLSLLMQTVSSGGNGSCKSAFRTDFYLQSAFPVVNLIDFDRGSWHNEGDRIGQPHTNPVS